MRLRTAGGLDHAIDTLTQRHGLLTNVHHLRSAPNINGSWRYWWRDTKAQLRSIFVDPRPLASVARSAIELETMTNVEAQEYYLASTVELAQTELAQVIARLKGWRTRMARPGKIVVPDTSALIDLGEPLGASIRRLVAPGSPAPLRLVIPIVVIEELDGLKRNVRQAARQAAHRVLRKLYEGAPDQQGIDLGDGVVAEVLLDDPDHARHPVTDIEIISQALVVQSYSGREVCFIAADYSQLFRARAEGLFVIRVDSSEVVSKSG